MKQAEPLFLRLRIRQQRWLAGECIYGLPSNHFPNWKTSILKQLLRFCGITWSTNCITAQMICQPHSIWNFVAAQNQVLPNQSQKEAEKSQARDRQNGQFLYSQPRRLCN